ncbi:endonuclease domain-containing 1 protein-like [Branchiostoma lanceolatum]|uniref:endonuclease domain-containing 1 protein-like n=1 Tax=Branchiostoma lanceolatum TaxID=7740 RepID=UPI003452AD3D
MSDMPFGAPAASPPIPGMPAGAPAASPPMSGMMADSPAAEVATEDKCIMYQVTDEAPVDRCMERCTNNYLQWPECSNFFVGTPWPPSSYSSAASCPICQRQADQTEVLFATRFNTEFRIPEYTADAIVRAPDGLEDPRDDDSSLWNRVQLGLCSSTFHDHIRDSCDFPETYWWGVTKVSSRSCRIPSALYLAECGDCQGLDDDYDGCGTDADRGHLNPNAINNRDEASREATFSFINVAPQAPSFNRHVWESFEEKVRYKAEEVYRTAEAAGSGQRTLYVITGTKTDPGNEWLKGRVAFPDFFWKAVCYPGDESAGLRPFGVGFYGRNAEFTEVEDMVTLALPDFDSWLYDGGNDHIFQGSVCATDVDKWDIENE